MGKGLSPLQKDILAIALDNLAERLANNWCAEIPDVFYAEVLHLHFGWPFACTRTNRHAYNKGNAEVLHYAHYEAPGSWVFSKEQIGDKKYNADMAALSRSMPRLEKRGLVECLTGKSAGALLTDAGIDAALTMTSAKPVGMP